jgi:putative proteasome-type protease
MTYCLGILLKTGLIMASDSRSNAGVDQLATVCKQTLITRPGDRVISILSAGNLATSQAVVTHLTQSMGSGREDRDMSTAMSLFDVATMVGERLREVLTHDEKFVEPYGDATASFLVGGQIQGEPPRLFQVYPAGNFIEATARSCFLQIGETKYGKPILDRILTPDFPLEDAAKLTLLSFDATLRSNLSVGPPIDMLVYEVGTFSGAGLRTLADDDPYFTALREAYGAGLQRLVESLPPPPSRP